MEFSKLLLILDYLTMFILILVCAFSQNMNMGSIAVAWVAQCGTSSAAYYWKAKNENRTKTPLNVIKSLPKSMREELDLTQIIIEILRKE